AAPEIVAEAPAQAVARNRLARIRVELRPAIPFPLLAEVVRVGRGRDESRHAGHHRKIMRMRAPQRAAGCRLQRRAMGRTLPFGPRETHRDNTHRSTSPGSLASAVPFSGPATGLRWE